MIYTYDFDGNTFEYEVAARELEKVIKEMIASDCKIQLNEEGKKVIDYFVSDLDLLYQLEEIFHEELLEKFEEEARDDYEYQIDIIEDEKDWFGTKDNVLGI